jgi:hypothetical protein
MVSTSTRRLPSTVIESTVCATAGADIATAAKVAATGTANMTKAANKPPLTRIPNIMRDAPLSFRAGPYPYGTGRFPTCCTACSQLCHGGKLTTAMQFHFRSKTLPIGNATKKPTSGSRDSDDIVVGGKDHEHENQSEPDPEPYLLCSLRQRSTENQLCSVEKQMTPIQQRDGKQV